MTPLEMQVFQIFCNSIEDQTIPTEVKILTVLKKIIDYGANNLSVDDIVALEDSSPRRISSLFSMSEEHAAFREAVNVLFTEPSSWFARAYRNGQAQRKYQLLEQLMTAANNGSIFALKDAIAIFSGLSNEKDNAANTTINQLLVFPGDCTPVRDVIDIQAQGEKKPEEYLVEE